MSPEQVRGKAVDKRTDIWSFGCVFYELLTGRSPFLGNTITEIVARVLEDEPDWNALPPSLPPKALELVRRCLQKDIDHRLRDLNEAQSDLEGGLFALSSARSGLATTLSISKIKATTWMRWSIRSAIGLSLILIGILAITLWSQRPVSPGSEFPLSVQASIAGAHILVDGKDHGITPQSFSLPEGEHRIDAAAPGYSTGEPVIVRLGHGILIRDPIVIPLKALPSILRLFTNFSQFTLDGKIMNVTDGGFGTEQLASGVHDLILTNPANGTVRIEFELTPGRVPTVRRLDSPQVRTVIVSSLGKEGQLYTNPNSRTLKISVNHSEARPLTENGLHLTDLEPGPNPIAIEDETGVQKEVVQAGPNPGITILVGSSVNSGNLLVQANVDEGTVNVEPVDNRGTFRQAQIRSGNAVVARLEPNVYRVLAFAQGYRPVEQRVPVKSGEAASIQFILERVMITALETQPKEQNQQREPDQRQAAPTRGEPLDTVRSLPSRIQALSARESFYATRALPPAARSHPEAVVASSSASPLGLRYSILKQGAGGQFSEVDVDTVFHSGDAVRVTVEANQDGYLYLLNKDTSGTWSLLFPPQIENGNNRVQAYRRIEVPAAAGSVFMFNGRPGVERLFIILSSRPESDLDISSLITTGQAAPITDVLLEKIRTRTNTSDLRLEKTVETTSNKENATYIVNAAGISPRVIVDVNLKHQ
jgi:hypothetical protein